MGNIATILMCEKSIVDKSGKISLISLFNQINTPGLPANFPAFTVFLRLLNLTVGQELKVELAILDPENVEIFKLVGEARTEKPNLDIPMEVHALAYNKFGLYTVSVTVNGNEEAQTEFEVRHAQ